jgi:hypothetical protein
MISLLRVPVYAANANMQGRKGAAAIAETSLYQLIEFGLGQIPQLSDPGLFIIRHVTSRREPNGFLPCPKGLLFIELGLTEPRLDGKVMFDQTHFFCPFPCAAQRGQFFADGN